MTSSNTVHVLSGGAAQGLVAALRSKFELVDSGPQNARNLAGSFGAVGAMVDRLLAGEPCDVLIVTKDLVAQLTDLNHLRAGSEQSLGLVKTGVAVKHGQTAPDVSTPAALKATLLGASGIYFPDPVKSTAGIHFMTVLNSLGIASAIAKNLRAFPNGATAMREMAQASETGLVGCTQVTEILYTPGVKLVATLPIQFELATDYTAAICARSANPALAQELIDLLSGAEAAALRKAAGFS